MEIESNIKKYMDLDEYEKEFAATGRNDFYAFLEEKKQEAINSGNNELAEHIENIYNQAIKEEQEYDEMAQYEADKKRQGEYGQEVSNVEDDIKQLKTEDLSILSIEELQKIASSNQEEILANEEEIKKSLVDKILGQQQTIAKQKEEIDRLKSQKEL